MLNDFVNFVNNYKTKHKMFILFIIKRFKTIITIFKIIVLTLLANIVVLILLLKKRERSFKTIENAFMLKEKKIV